MDGVHLEKKDEKLTSDHADEARKSSSKAITKGSAKATAKASKLNSEVVEGVKKVGKRTSAPLVEGDSLSLRMSGVNTTDASAVDDSKSLSDFING